jgi:uncharacterized protein (UPF0332 family)
MKDADKIAYVKYRLAKADETLQAAELLMNNQQWNSAINRLYYAAYYAITALLVQAQVNTKTHSGVKTQFFLHYVKTGKVAIHLGKVYSDLFDWRQKGDYNDFFDFSKEDVESIFPLTKELMDAVKQQIT